MVLLRDLILFIQIHTRKKLDDTFIKVELNNNHKDVRCHNLQEVQTLEQSTNKIHHISKH